MIRQIAPTVVAFDAEWVPDPITGRRIYELPSSATDDDVRERMWAEARKPDSEDSRPYLKPILCRVVSIAAVIRTVRPAGPPALQIHSVPSPGEGPLPEAEIIERFLEGGIGKQDTQLVGFNSSGADLPILIQRGVAHGISAPGFSWRPGKPWEGRDYFVRHGDWHIDLMNVLSPSGRTTPSLSQIALAAGIPGKAEVTGADVVDLWLGGEVRRIVEYNQADALTTYLLWLRVVHFAGLLTDEQYTREQETLMRVLEDRGASDAPHLLRYLDRWRTLQGA